jgi:small multidrug resistance family-3 protein
MSFKRTTYADESFCQVWFRRVCRAIGSNLKTQMKTFILYLATALTEIVGCFLPYLWLRQNGPVWVLVPAAISLAAFTWLLTLHEAASGRVYASYGGVYIATAIAWLYFVDGIRPSIWDVVGVTVILTGVAIIVYQPH